MVGANFFFYFFLRLNYFSDGSFPFDLGCESIGEVVAVGKDVNEFSVGDNIVSPWLGSAYTEMLCRDVDEGEFIKVPKCSPAYMGAAVAGLTASIGLKEAGEMGTGETILITAAAGGVGNWCVQLAKMAGNHVIGTCSSEEKAKELTELSLNTLDRIDVSEKDKLKNIAKYLISRQN